MSVDLDISVEVSTIARSLSDRHAAELLDYLSDHAESIVRRMKPRERSPWRKAFLEQLAERASPEKAILGHDWRDVEEMLDRGDIYELRRWLMPFVKDAKPRPVFRGDKQ